MLVGGLYRVTSHDDRREALVERHRVGSQPPERPREIPCALRWSFAKRLVHFADHCPVGGEATALAFKTGAYFIHPIATVSAG